MQKLGTRAVIAEALASQHENVFRGVVAACEAAANGDVSAQRALNAFIDQAWGKPTERVEFKQPSTLEDLEQMSEGELERLVAEGRRRRLERLGPERLGLVEGNAG